MKNRMKRLLVACGLVLVAAVVGTIMVFGSVTPAISNPPANTDPRVGPVDVARNVYKICDGTTLLYINDDGDAGGLAAIVHSSECAP